MSANVLNSAPVSRVALFVERYADAERSVLKTLSDGTTLEVLSLPDGTSVKVFTPAGIALDGALADSCPGA